MNDRAALARTAALLALAFVATLGLLAGAAALLARNAPRGSAGETPVAGASAPTNPPGSGASGAPASAGAATIVITGAGDIAQCGSDGPRQTSDLLLAQPGSFFTAGDNAYEDGSPANYAQCYAPTWGRALDRTILPAAGNHDWQTRGAAGYLAYFGTKAAPRGVTWYSTDLGAWHVVVLDSDCDQVGGCDAASPEGRWLAADLAASTTACTLAIWHHPRFSSGEHGDDSAVGPFWDLLFEHHADLVINGHDHDYERFAPQDPAGRPNEAAGVREIVAGTGGAGLRGFPTHAPNSEVRIAAVWGVLQLTLHPDSYGWQFLSAGASRATDSGSAACH